MDGMCSESTFYKTLHIKGGDFLNAGRASQAIKGIVRSVGLPPGLIRRLAIAAYEAEMNVVLYARDGAVELAITPEKVLMVFCDEGPGIEDTDLAMKEGYSTASREMRELGFGAGMGLPNIKKNVDVFSMSSTVGKGTVLEMTLDIH